MVPIRCPLATPTRRLVALLLLLAPGWPLAPGPAAAAAPEEVWRGGAVSTDHPLAAEAGRSMLARGGNAVDAAVATSFALSVVRPYSCGIGGGGFMILHLAPNGTRPARDLVLDYRETCPAGVAPGAFEALEDPDASRFTGLAVAVPGTVAGLLHALEHHGTLDLPTVMAPALALAEQGFPVDEHYLRQVDSLVVWFERNPARYRENEHLWKHLLGEGRLAPGEVIRSPGQFMALQRIAREGRAGFYEGEVAQAMVDAVRAHGGVLSPSDLRNYRVRTRAPLRGAFHGRTILAMPPPSSGGVTMLQILGILERYEHRRPADLARMRATGSGARYVHVVTEAMKHAFADRSRYLGDPGFAPVPTARLLAPAYLDRLAAAIDDQGALPLEAYGTTTPAPEDHGTSHFSVVDAAGNAVSCTETINLVFGSRISAGPFGFMLNNEMDDFTTRRGQANAFGLKQSDWNLPGPGKRPLSSMSPTIILDSSGGVELLAGGSGGPRIITGTLQAILNVLVHGDDAATAVWRRRFHHQWLPDMLFLESREPTHAPIPRPQETFLPWNRVPVEPWNDARPCGATTPFETLLAALRARGHLLGSREDVGVVQVLVRSGSGYTGAADPRKGGSAVGLVDPPGSPGP